MVRTQIYIPDSLHEEAKILAAKKKKSLAQLVREYMFKGIEQEKAAMKTKKLSSLSSLKIRGGPKDLSGRLDSYLYGR